jgi:poly(A) polymerase
LHDVEKPSTKGVDEEGCIHFFDHEGKGAKVVGEILKRLRFSRGEVKLACTIVANHMRPSELAAQEVITKRDSYRFFRDTGDAGVDTLLLYLADHLATWGPNLIQERWRKRVEAVASLLTDYYMERIISPPKLIGGSDLMEEFALEEGPLIGRLLEEVREAQVMGEVKTREEALEYARSLLRKMESNGSESGSKTVSFARI